MSLLTHPYTGLQDYDPPTLDDLRARLRREEEAAVAEYHVEVARKKKRARYAKTLTDRQRRALELREQGLSLQEAGEVMGITWRAVAAHCTRGRAFLRAEGRL